MEKAHRCGLLKANSNNEGLDGWNKNQLFKKK